MTKQTWAVNVLEGNMEGYTNEERKSYLEDVTSHGCISGCVGGVIYYSETGKIFREHLDSILTAIEDYDYEMGGHVLGTMDATDIPNKAVWFVVEQTAYEMLRELEEADEDEEDEEE